MLLGMLSNQATLPQTLVAGGTSTTSTRSRSISGWARARSTRIACARLMGITGDDVPAIMKALQLDVGFVHQYMDVHYQVNDAEHGEFWLEHCGALLNVEPFGEERVVGMCHTIEDPTFDATAYATNPARGSGRSTDRHVFRPIANRTVTGRSRSIPTQRARRSGPADATDRRAAARGDCRSSRVPAGDGLPARVRPQVPPGRHVRRNARRTCRRVLRADPSAHVLRRDRARRTFRRRARP